LHGSVVLTLVKMLSSDNVQSNIWEIVRLSHVCINDLNIESGVGMFAGFHMCSN